MPNYCAPVIALGCNQGFESFSDILLLYALAQHYSYCTLHAALTRNETAPFPLLPHLLLPKATIFTQSCLATVLSCARQQQRFTCSLLFVACCHDTTSTIFPKEKVKRGSVCLGSESGNVCFFRLNECTHLSNNLPIRFRRKK